MDITGHTDPQSPPLADVSTISNEKSIDVDQGRISPQTMKPQGEGTRPSMRKIPTQLICKLPAGFSLNKNDALISHDAGGPVCGPLRVLCHVRRADNSDWAAQLLLHTRAGDVILALVSHQDLYSDRFGWASSLRSKGFVVESPLLLRDLIQAWDAPQGLLVDQPGWIGPGAHKSVYLQKSGFALHETTADPEWVALANPIFRSRMIRGKGVGWRDTVAPLCLGNDPLILAIAVALTGPLLQLTGMRTLAINLHGGPSTGKSLALAVATSCHDAPDAIAYWSSEKKVLEQKFTMANDGLMAIDCVPANPSATQLTTLLETACDDRCQDPGRISRRAILTCSEEPMSALIRRHKKMRPQALAARWIDLPIGDDEHGAFADLHGHPSAQSLAKAIMSGIAEHHGHLLHEFMRNLIHLSPGSWAVLERRIDKEKADFIESLDDRLCSIAAIMSEQMHRLGLIITAGELAIGFGLLPWPKNTVRDAIRRLANRWLAIELDEPFMSDRAENLQAYLTAHKAMFARLDDEPPRDQVSDSSGWQDGDYFYVRPRLMESLGITDNDTKRYLIHLGVIVPGGEQNSCQYKLPATAHRDRPRAYRISKEAIGIDC